MTSRANKDIVAAWAACVTQTGGLACYKKPGENVVGITYEELANSGSLQKVTITPTNMKIANPATVVPELAIGDSGLAYTVTDTKKDATLLINGRTELTNFGQSCSVLVKSSSTINMEVGKVWSKLADSYLAIATSLSNMNASGWKKEPRDRIVSAVIAKYSNALTRGNACANGGTCTPPAAADYKYSYVLRGAGCTTYKYPTMTFNHNVLSTTGASEVTRATNHGNQVLTMFTLCASVNQSARLW